MSRIIAGQARGRTLSVPKSGTRPTSDRVRESVFSMLDHRIETWDGLNVLDLYAGSGALGLEAISRGAARATLVDSSHEASNTCKKNAKVVADDAVVEVVNTSVDSYLARFDYSSAYDDSATGTASQIGLVFVDPPYEMDSAALSETVKRLSKHILKVGAFVVVERSSRSDKLALEAEFEVLVARSFGDTEVHLFCWMGR